MKRALLALCLSLWASWAQAGDALLAVNPFMGWFSPGKAEAQGFPTPGGVNITASVTATTGAFSATLPAVSGKYNWLCGFIVSSGGTTAAIVVNVTVTGLVSGTNNYAYVFPSSGQGALGAALPSCIGASATNTAITVSVPAGGAGTVAALTVWGIQQ